MHNTQIIDENVAKYLANQQHSAESIRLKAYLKGSSARQTRVSELKSSISTENLKKPISLTMNANWLMDSQTEFAAWLGLSGGNAAKQARQKALVKASLAVMILAGSVVGMMNAKAQETRPVQEANSYSAVSFATLTAKTETIQPSQVESEEEQSASLEETAAVEPQESAQSEQVAEAMYSDTVVVE